MNKYITKVNDALRLYIRDKNEMHIFTKYSFGPESVDSNMLAYKDLIKRLIHLLKMDLKYFDYFPEILQKDENIILAYHTIYNTIYVNEEAWGALAEIYENQVDYCWNYHDKKELKENIDAIIYKDYIPDNVETGITRK